MASIHRTTCKLGWLVACFLTAGVGCDDDAAAESAGEQTAIHAGEHDASHGSAGGSSEDAEHDASHGSAGSGADEGEHEHDTNAMIGPPTGAQCPSDSTLTYDNFGKQFMQDYCLRCHSTSVAAGDRHDAPPDHNFDTIDDITLLAKHIDEMAGSGPDNTNETMPPSDPKPTTEERAKLSQWLACGAPTQ